MSIQGKLITKLGFAFSSCAISLNKEKSSKAISRGKAMNRANGGR